QGLAVDVGPGALVRGVVLDGVVLQSGAAGVVVDPPAVADTGCDVVGDRVVGQRHGRAAGVIVDPPALAGAAAGAAGGVETHRAVAQAQRAKVVDPSAVAVADTGVAAAGGVAAHRAVAQA